MSSRVGGPAAVRQGHFMAASINPIHSWQLLAEQRGQVAGLGLGVGSPEVQRAQGRMDVCFPSALSPRAPGDTHVRQEGSRTSVFFFRARVQL